MKIVVFVAVACALLASGVVLSASMWTKHPAPKQEVRLVFKAGMLNHVNIREELKITMHFPQVDNDDVRPSTRITDYDFTESVKKVNPDGSALIGMTLDSFKTKIILGKGHDKEEFFKFNSNNDDDLQKKFHDIRTLPRAQFLGQELRFTVGVDGQIKSFENLDQFHQMVMGKDYDYDFMHAMLSLADSTRLSQLFEHGFGVVAAASNHGKPFIGASTTTEIPVTRNLTVRSQKPTRDGDSISIVSVLTNAPTHIDYLEGLAANLGLSDFKGGGSGYAIVRNGMVSRAGFRDSSSMKLQVDIETVPEEIVRSVSSTRTSIAVLRGGSIHIVEEQEHRGVYKEPVPDSNSEIIDANTGTVTEPASHKP